MDQDTLIPFQGSQVKLILKPNFFILRGTLEEVFSDSVLFKTEQKTAVISFDRIAEISMDNRSG